MIMKTEKVYIVIAHYAMRDKNIGVSIVGTLEAAMEEVDFELAEYYTIDVEVYESDKAERFFFGKLISKHIKD